MDFLKYNISLIWNLVLFSSIMKVGQILERTTSTRPMPFHTTSMTIFPMVLGRFILYVLLTLPKY